MTFIVGSFALIVFACLLTSFVVCCAVMIVGAHNVGFQADVYLCPLSCGLKHDQLRGLINDFVLEVSNISLLRSKLLCLKLLIDDRVTLNLMMLTRKMMMM